MIGFADRRRRMVEEQLRARGIADARVLAAMAAMPREDFVPDNVRDRAYDDRPLSIEAGQTVSQPFIVAFMAEAAAIGPGDRVLEVGAGSGYAAAVLGRLGAEVVAVERHPVLAAGARRRLAALGAANVTILDGDGTLGCPERAPFDAILVAAGAPAVPEALKAQLAVGGRLLVPVGKDRRGQSLVKVTRRSADDYATEDLGGVLFVPLIGAQGWADEAGEPARPAPSPGGHLFLPDAVRDAAEPLPALDDPGFGAAFDRFADARVVLLGEATHGTSEFHRARAAITRRLIERHGFGIVAVEADWPDAAAVNRVVRGAPPRAGADPPFTRFPTWMWRNTDVAAFVSWLRGRNAGVEPSARAGFYGLDRYNLNASVRAVIDHLDRVDPEAARVARRRYGCLTPWRDEPGLDGRLAMTTGFASREDAVAAMLTDRLRRQWENASDDAGGLLDAAGHARLVRDAERHCRAMVHASSESWNLRGRHMFDTLEALLDAEGPGARAVVWAHNSHIGDARRTEMGWARGELNLGQLCRGRWRARAALIGFGTHAGTVAAAEAWDGPMRVQALNPSLDGSYERLMHDAGLPRFLLDLRAGRNDALRADLAVPKPERFVGAVYRPGTERWSHYADAAFSEQFDACVWFDRTSAVTPTAADAGRGPGDPFPSGS